MTTKNTHGKESFELLEESAHRCETSLDGDTLRLYVLETIERGDELRDRPTLVLCPGCGSEVERYEGGLPSYVSWFKTDCEGCDVELRRWSVVALDAAYAELVSEADLEALVTEYWDQHLWAGIETAEGCPRTWEFSRAYADRAEAYDWDWKPTCPLCRRSLGELPREKLDYHHWRREPDQGICLCRTCHDSINGGSRDKDVDWRARQLGLRNKHDLQILRLAAREHLFEPAKTLDEFSVRLVERYNLVQSPDDVRQIIEQAARSDAIKSLVEREIPDFTV